MFHDGKNCHGPLSNAETIFSATTIVHLCYNINIFEVEYPKTKSFCGAARIILTHTFLS